MEVNGEELRSTVALRHPYLRDLGMEELAHGIWTPPWDAPRARIRIRMERRNDAGGAQEMPNVPETAT